MSQDPRIDFDLVASEVEAEPGVTRGAWFGMPCLKSNGKVFAGYDAQNGAMVFKLRGDAHTRALSLHGAHLFDPSGRGRPMKEWVELPHEHASLWLDICREAHSAAGAAAG